MKVAVFALVVAFGLATGASAQTAPWKAEFTPSTDHNTVEQQVPIVTDYALLVFAPGATTTPIAGPVSLGKPNPNASNVISVDINATLIALPASTNCNPTSPTPAQCYTATVVARGPGGTSTSLPSGPFALLPRTPGQAGQPVIIRR